MAGCGVRKVDRAGNRRLLVRDSIYAPYGLDWLLIFGRRQLERVLRTYVDHYNLQRPHRALALDAPNPIGELVPLPRARPRIVHRRDRLGGLLHEYELAA